LRDHPTVAAAVAQVRCAAQVSWKLPNQSKAK